MNALDAARIACADLSAVDPRWAAALPVLQQLRPHLTAPLLEQVLAGPLPPTFTALFTAPDECVTVAGWRVLATTANPCGRRLHVDDLVTAAEHRGHGYGAQLLTELERRARAAGADVLEVDSGTQRTSAHHFYLEHGLEITCLHFGKQVG